MPFKNNKIEITVPRTSFVIMPISFFSILKAKTQTSRSTFFIFIFLSLPFSAVILMYCFYQNSDSWSLNDSVSTHFCVLFNWYICLFPFLQLILSFFSGHHFLYFFYLSSADHFVSHSEVFLTLLFFCRLFTFFVLNFGLEIQKWFFFGFTL